MKKGLNWILALTFGVSLNYATPAFAEDYTVRKGDNLSKIAEKYNLSLREIVEANPKIEDPDLIKVNQTIDIPSKKKTNVDDGIDYSLLMPDKEFTNHKAYNKKEIQGYLDSIDSVLKNPIEGAYFSDKVIELSRKYKINPLLLLTRAQVEKGVVKKRKATEKELREIMGYGIPYSSRRNKRMLGYSVQLENSARILRKHFDEFKKGVKVKVNYGKDNIYPENATTYSLLTYTPHTIDTKLEKKGGGNYLVIKVYDEFKTVLANNGKIKTFL